MHLCGRSNQKGAKMHHKDVVVTGVVKFKPECLKNEYSDVSSFILRSEHYLIDKNGLSEKNEYEYCVILPGNFYTDLLYEFEAGTICQIHGIALGVEDMDLPYQEGNVNDYILANRIVFEIGTFKRDID